jgi:hypothetical protein
MKDEIHVKMGHGRFSLSSEIHTHKGINFLRRHLYLTEEMNISWSHFKMMWLYFSSCNS